MSIRSKLTLSFIILISVSIFSVSFMSLASTKARLVDQAEKQMQSVAAVQEERIKEIIRQYHIIAQGIGSRTQLRANIQHYLEKPDKILKTELLPILKDATEPFEEVHEVVIVSPDGLPIASNSEIHLATNYKGVGYFEKAKRAPVIESLKKSDNHEIIVARAIQREEILLGVLIVHFSSDPLKSVMQDYTGLGETGETLVAFRNEEGDAGLISTARLMGAPSVISKNQLTSPITQSLLTKEILMKEAVDYRGESVLASTRYIKELDWGVVVKIDRKELFRSLQILRLNLIMMSLAILAIAVFSSVLIAQSITWPITLLSQEARKISKENLNIRLSSKLLMSKDETGDLAKAFVDMIAKLKGFYRELEEKVKERTKDLQKFRLAVKNASDHIVITDKKGVILYANEATEHVTGFEQKQVIGKTPDLWSAYSKKEYSEKIWKKIKKSKNVFIGEVKNKRKNGEPYIAELHISPITDEKGTIQFFVSIERDITKAKEVDRMKTEFISLASHQLRTPLSGMNWNMEMLLAGRMGKLNEIQKEHIGMLYEASKRLTTLVSDLLNVSRLEGGRLRVETEPVNMPQFIRSIIEECKPLTIKKSCYISFKTKEDDEPLMADKTLLRQVIHNLITNAIKYSKEQRGTVVINLKKVKEGDILISIKDDGIGIPKKVQSRIFERFFRADNARETETDGTGLGLYISKMIIENSGGKIWFESEENKGTIFYVSINAKGMRGYKEIKK